MMMMIVRIWTKTENDSKQKLGRAQNVYGFIRFVIILLIIRKSNFYHKFRKRNFMLDEAMLVAFWIECYFLDELRVHNRNSQLLII